jgi:hypothetical protein
MPNSCSKLWEWGYLIEKKYKRQFLTNLLSKYKIEIKNQLLKKELKLTWVNLSTCDLDNKT